MRSESEIVSPAAIVNVVVLVPSFTVTVWPTAMPSEASVVAAPLGSRTPPVPTAFASGSRVAPTPVIFAAAGAPTSGFAVNPTGLSRLEPGMVLLLLAVVGLLARLAWYWIWVVGWAGTKLVLNWSTEGTLPSGLPVEALDRNAHQVVAGAVDQDSRPGSPGSRRGAYSRSTPLKTGWLSGKDAGFDTTNQPSPLIAMLVLMVDDWIEPWTVLVAHRFRQHAAGGLLAGRRQRHQGVEARVGLLEAGGLRVRDVAGDVLQRERLRLQAPDSGRERIEKTHDCLQLRSGRPPA